MLEELPRGEYEFTLGLSDRELLCKRVELPNGTVDSVELLAG